MLQRAYAFHESGPYAYMYAAVCCSVLQCVAVCCVCVAVCCSECMSLMNQVHMQIFILQYVAVCCSVLQYAAVCCSVLQCVAASL